MTDPLKPPVAVEIAGSTPGAEPVPVAIVSGDPRSANRASPTMREQSQTHDPSLPAKTTFQEDLTKASQRLINLKWEGTQQVIAILITATVLVVCAYVVMAGDQELRQSAFIFLTNIAFLVIGTYFQRTNHTKTGGVGAMETGR